MGRSMTASGSKGMPALTVSEMKELYASGMSLIDISLRARLNYKAIKILLTAHGVRLRTRQETWELQGRKRAAWRALMPEGK